VGPVGLGQVSARLEQVGSKVDFRSKIARKSLENYLCCSLGEIHSIAQYNLGQFYIIGRGVARDDVEGVRWCRLAADQGDVGGQYLLGAFYDNGRGVAEDVVEAVKWCRLAANQGHAGAQSMLGEFYENGRGVAQDNGEAARWYRLSANQGDVEARTALARVDV
jgi:TPR repeat protein